MTTPPSLVGIAVSVSDPTTLLLVAGLVVLGLLVLALLAGAALMMLRWRHLSAADADTFRATLSGPLELVGTASVPPGGDSFRAGVSATECLVSELEVQTYESGSKGGGSWTTQESRTTTRPFHVETAGGTVRVEPDGATLVLDTRTVAELDGGEDATGRTAAVLEAIGVKRTTGSVDLGVTTLDYGDRTRLRERRVDVGETVYVAGTAVTDDSAVGGFGGPDAVVRELTGRSRLASLLAFPFVVGDGGETAVRRYFLKRAFWFGLLAVLFAAVWVALASVALA
jgi:hypothetical protein